MPNTQTSVPLYAQGEVLTAANLNLTNSGIPVFATTVTRDAAFGGANEKVLAEGQFAYIEATNTTQYYDGANWQSVGASSGLTLISNTTIGSTVSSVTVSSVFSATYDSYRIIINGGVGSANLLLQFQLSGLTTGYYGASTFADYTSGAVTGVAINNASSNTRAGSADVDVLFFVMDVINPFLTKYTQMISTNVYDVASNRVGTTVCKQNGNTSVTGFVLTPSTGTLTGGTIRVYGYLNS